MSSQVPGDARGTLLPLIRGQGQHAGALRQDFLRAQRQRHLAHLLSGHLEGLTAAGAAVWLDALAAPQRWREPGEACVASAAFS